jgi:hypothetical protein
MAEDTARALGVGVGEIEIAGKMVPMRPLGVGDLLEVEREAVDAYRRSYLQAIKDTADLLDDGQDVLKEELLKAAKWTSEDLPDKAVYDIKTGINPKVVKWINQNTDMEIPPDISDTKYKQLVAGALDRELISEEKYEELTGAKASKVLAPYMNWWITASPDGMIAFIYQMCKGTEGITKKDVAAAFNGKTTELMHAARKLESVTAPEVGNG